MYVRFPDASAPDAKIHPPVGAQSFTVPNLAVAQAPAVRIFAPGVVPPPK